MAPKVMLVIIVILAVPYILVAHKKDERRNALIAACEAKGYSHKACRDHYKRFKPLPEFH